MCGIVGILGAQESDWILAMNGRIFHRGPDDRGVYRDSKSDVSLAMRRLAIIDIADGHQPMSTADGRYTLVFNGEIFNAGTLRSELEADGVKFKTHHSDTEVLLQMLVRHGELALPMLNGMFAFAFWDSLEQRLLCARDRFGIKPFYYVSHAGRLAIASEMKSLLVLPWVQRAIDSDSLSHYMSLMYVPGTKTAIEHISRLSAGDALTWSAADGIKLHHWWKHKPGLQASSERQEAVSSIRTALENAVESWFTSDVSVGCSLSGGLDSSAIVGLLAQKGHKLKTYSVGFTGRGEAQWNELPLARAVSERWGTEHHEIMLEPDSLLDDLLDMVWHLDEPYGGGLPSWSVFKQMSGEVKVGMTGTGGDELFGNYGKWRELEGNWVQRTFGYNKVDVTRFRNHFFDRYYYLSDHDKQSAVLEHHVANVDTCAWIYSQHYLNAESSNIRDKCAFTDIVTQLPEEFLMMTDRFSMAHSIEARTPFLDNTLSDLVLGLPASVRTSRHDLKGLLRDAVADVLPAELLHAPKRGFVIPLKLWLRGRLRPLVEWILSPARLADQGLFKPDFYSNYVLPHLEGHRDHTQVVWCALMFQLWHLVFIEGNGQKPSFGVKDIMA